MTPEPHPRAQQPSHDDYCRIFGKILFDAYSRVDSLEHQVGSLYEGFRSQIAAARQRIDELEQGGRTEGDRG